MKKIQHFFFRLLTGFSPKTLKSIEQYEKLMSVSQSNINSDLSETYLFDFKNWATQYNGNAGSPILITGMDSASSSEPAKIKIKPIDVLGELETVPTPFSLALIDEKIGILNEKAKLIVQHYAKREVEALVQRLENRKKYPEHKSFFEGYQNTTDEKIDIILRKYDLVMKTSDIFVPEFPDDAIQAMKIYTEKMQQICDKKPVFYVIAEAKDFKKAYEKRDPILLAQSPFGFYWQILGAWDKEMLILSEL